MHEPVMTWNLFLTAILVPASVTALGYFAKKMFDSWKAGWKEAEELKQKNYEEWRTTLKESLRQGSETMQALKDQLNQLVTRDYCEDSHAEMHETLNDHGERIVALEVNVKHLQRQP